MDAKGAHCQAGISCGVISNQHSVTQMVTLGVSHTHARPRWCLLLVGSLSAKNMRRSQLLGSGGRGVGMSAVWKREERHFAARDASF